MTINGLNKWTPAIYKSVSPVNWTAERNRSENFRNANKPSRQPVVVASGK